MKRCVVCLEFFAWLLIAQSMSHGQTQIRIGFAGGLNLAKQSYNRDIIEPDGFRSEVILSTVAEVEISK